MNSIYKKRKWLVPVPKRIFLAEKKQKNAFWHKCSLVLRHDLGGKRCSHLRGATEKNDAWTFFFRPYFFLFLLIILLYKTMVATSFWISGYPYRILAVAFCCNFLAILAKRRVLVYNIQQIIIVEGFVAVCLNIMLQQTAIFLALQKLTNVNLGRRV